MIHHRGLPDHFALHTTVKEADEGLGEEGEGEREGKGETREGEDGEVGKGKEGLRVVQKPSVE